jgi:hypothetical protein
MLQADTMQKQRQAASLRESGSNTISGESAQAFVAERRWLLVPAANLERTDGNRIVSVGETNMALGAPLTQDGYVLTSDWILDQGPPAALNRMDARPARVVKVFPDSEMALVKFPYGVKQHFEQLAAEVEAGQTVFNEAAKGTVKTDGVPPWKAGARSIECKLPSVSGNVGGPVATADGELVGLIEGVYQMRLTKRLTSGTMVKMVEPAILQETIKSDRVAQR